MNTIKFKQWNCTLDIAQYGNGQPALILNDAEDGSRVAVASVNLEEMDLIPPPGHIYIKDYSENEGMLDCLVDAGIVEDTGKRVPLHFVDVPLCKLLIEVPEVAQE